MRELEVYEAGVHACGFHRSLLDDKSNLFQPGTWTCPVCQAAAREQRKLRREDEKRRDKDDPYAPDPADGRDLHIRLLSPAEAEEYRRSVAEQAPGE